MSFRDGYRMAEGQVDPARYLTPAGEVTPEYGIAEACVRLMADVYSKPDAVIVDVGGEQRPAREVREIYALLSADAVWAMIDETDFREARFLRAYLRTALYNAALMSTLTIL